MTATDVAVELEGLREAEQKLLNAVSVSPDAAVRRDKSLVRVRSEIRRLERLLKDEAA